MTFTRPVLPAGSLSLRHQPVLTVGELTLRPWAADDVAAMFEAYSDPLIQQWNGMRVATLADAAGIIADWSGAWAKEIGANWAITGPEVMGRMSLRLIDLDEGTGEVAYWAMPAARGRGVVRRALAAVTQWAFDDLGLHRLELLHSVANSASCRVAEKAGYRCEGIKRSAALHDDGWHDLHLHARIQGDG
jgi:RimJ/RimL family protein N-acetyltransferase